MPNPIKKIKIISRDKIVGFSDEYMEFYHKGKTIYVEGEKPQRFKSAPHEEVKKMIEAQEIYKSGGKCSHPNVTFNINGLGRAKCRTCGRNFTQHPRGHYPGL